MGQVLSVFVIGLSYGLVLFLLAAGLSLTMGLMRVINMAHGALYMFAAYLGVWVVKVAHNWVLGLLAGAMAAALIGLFMETLFLRRLYKREGGQVLLTIGFIYILTNIAQWLWGTYPLSGPVPKILSASVPVGNVELPVFRLFIIGFGLVMAFALWWLQDRTKMGGRVRAGMDNHDVAEGLGINLKLVFTGVFVLGSFVAGLCGLVGAKLTGVNLGIGWEALLLSLIVVVVGGTGSVQGALLGGVLIGLINAFGTAYFPQVAYFLIYAVLLVILLIRPSGLLGRKMDVPKGAEDLEAASLFKRRALRAKAQSKEQEDQATPPAVCLTSVALPRAAWESRLHRLVPYLFILAALVVVPLFLNGYWQGMVTEVLIFALFAMSLDLLMGYTGLISFGHAAFFGLAGYATALLTTRYGVTSFWLVLLISLGLTAALSAVIGYLSLRVTGLYFLLVTLAFGQLLWVTANKWYSFTGGTNGVVGVPRPQLGPHPWNWTSLTFYFFVLVVLVLCFLILHRIVNSSFGKALVGVRANEQKMKSLGFNTWALKYVSFILAGVFAGVAGVLFSYYYGAITPTYLGVETSALPMLMVIMGGVGTLYGPFLGALVIIVAQTEAGLYLPDRWPLVLGAVFVFCVMVLRGGFARYLSRAWDKWGWVTRSKRSTRQAVAQASSGLAAVEAVGVNPAGVKQPGAGKAQR